MPMKTILRTLMALMLLSSTLVASDLVNSSGSDKIAVSGYDTVAFFTDSQPIKGSPSIAARYQGATYLFANTKNKSLFEESPDKYVPQYGGFCAYGVAHGGLAPVEISTWQVRGGKLYLNKNSEIRTMFDADFDGNVAKAEKNWPGLVRSSGK
jgi:YHS domain-containing protein